MKVLVLAGLLAGLPTNAATGQAPGPIDSEPPGVSEPSAANAAEVLVAHLPPPQAALAGEVLARNPDLARARRTAAAAELRAPQVGSFPDPMATLTPFLVSAETRVGPQQLTAALSQRLPWFGKLALRERAALFAAAAADAEVEAQAVALVTETRRLYYELAFLAVHEAVVRSDRATLEHYERLARARYASGFGLEQAVVKIQAEISKDDQRLLEVANRRAAVSAALDALRDGRPGGEAMPWALPAEVAVPELDFDALLDLALAHRPETAGAELRIAEARTRVELARKDYLPDVTVGLSYTLVGRRDDRAGRATPPEGNGDDVVALTAGINLPVWRQRLAAGVEEASERELAAHDARRGVDAAIAGTLSELVHRIPLLAEQYELLAEILTIQAEEALRSAEAAYGAGTLGALELLDAERVLLDVRVAAARTLADLAIAVARLEGAVAVPLGRGEAS